MPAPQNYMLNLPDPTTQVLGGMSAGLLVDETQRSIDQRAAEAQQQAAHQKTMFDLANNPNLTLQDFQKAYLTLPPKQAEMAKKVWDLQSQVQKDNSLKFSGDVSMALASGNTDVAVDLLDKRAEAEANSGNETKANLYRGLSQAAKSSPDTAINGILTGLANIPGGDKIIESVLKIKGTGLEGKKVDIETQKLALRKDENKLRAMEAGLKRETNDLKKQELKQKIEDTRLKIDKNKLDIVSKSEVAVQNTENALGLVSDILENVNIDAITGFSSLVPTVRPETQDDLNKITQLKNLLTLDNLKLMTGVLTDRDMQVLSSAASGLIVDEKGVKGSESGVRKQLEKIKNKLGDKLKEASAGASNLKEKYGKSINRADKETQQSMTLEERLAKYGVQ